MSTLCEIVGLISSCREYQKRGRVMLAFQALLPTRRWFNTILDDSHLLVHCYLSSLVHREEDGHLFSQVSLVDRTHLMLSSLKLVFALPCSQSKSLKYGPVCCRFLVSLK